MEPVRYVNLSRGHLRYSGACISYVNQLQYCDWFIKQETSGPAVQWSSGPVGLLLCCSYASKNFKK